MIQLSYEQPTEGQEQLTGTYVLASGEFCTFRTPIVYIDGVMDLSATEANLLEVINQDAEIKALMGA